MAHGGQTPRERSRTRAWRIICSRSFSGGLFCSFDAARGGRAAAAAARVRRAAARLGGRLRSTRRRGARWRGPPPHIWTATTSSGAHETGARETADGIPSDAPRGAVAGARNPEGDRHTRHTLCSAACDREEGFGSRFCVARASRLTPLTWARTNRYLRKPQTSRMGTIAYRSVSSGSACVWFRVRT